MHLSAQSALSLTENDAVKTIELGAGTGLVCTSFRHLKCIFMRLLKAYS